MSKLTRPDYGIDAPYVLRNNLLFGVGFLALALLGPPALHLGPVMIATRSFFWPAGACLLVAALFLLYVKVGKFRHRDFMLGMHAWRGDEQVLDVGCGKGLLLTGAARRIDAIGGSGHVTGIDIWSTSDMRGNSVAATTQNLRLEGVEPRCTLISQAAQDMPFADASFDLVVSNLCLHNIYDRPTRQRAIAQIARVLKPGASALISDYKLTGEYARQLQALGFVVQRRRGSLVTTFPPLTVVIATRPAA